MCEGGLPVPQRMTTHTCVYGQYCSAWIYNYFKDMKHEVGVGLGGAEEREGGMDMTQIHCTHI